MLMYVQYVIIYVPGSTLAVYNKTCRLQSSSICFFPSANGKDPVSQESPHSIFHVLGQNHLVLSVEKHKDWMLALTGALTFSIPLQDN